MTTKTKKPKGQKQMNDPKDAPTFVLLDSKVESASDASFTLTIDTPGGPVSFSCSGNPLKFTVGENVVVEFQRGTVADRMGE